MKAKNNDNKKKHDVAVRSLFFRLVLWKNVRAYGTLISPFNSFKLRREKSGNSEVFYHALATYDISLRCSVLWNSKKSTIYKWIQENQSSATKINVSLNFFSNGIAISKDLLESHFRNKEVLPYFGNMKTPNQWCLKQSFYCTIFTFWPPCVLCFDLSLSIFSVHNPGPWSRSTTRGGLEN